MEVRAPPGLPHSLEEYRLVRPLGQGAMGLVFLAHDTLLDRLVAIKLVRGAISGAGRARFLIEARAAARLHHPNVVSVYRVGDVGGHPYIVSEFVRGTSLDKVAKPMPSSKVLELAVGLSRGLAAAHRQGVLHRDLKPANAIIRDDGSPVLVDFGLAKLITNTRAPTNPFEDTQVSRVESLGQPTLTIPPDPLSNTISETGPELPGRGGALPELDDERHGLTAAGAIMGTPYYMAPEIWEGQEATARSDIYSLGAFLYELAAGVPPHKGVAGLELCMVATTRDAPPLAERAPELRRDLAELIHRCLDRDPSHRPASGEELSRALELLVAPQRRAPLPAGNPYRGLLPFGSEHHGVFFGREADVAGVLDRLRSESLVIVAGDSGVGKSSLVRAGVLPRIEAGELGADRRWRVAVMRPGRAPLQTLAAALPGVDPNAESSVARMLASDPDGAVNIVRTRLAVDEGRVLVVDQLEELATMSSTEEARQAAESLARLTASHPGVKVLATVRADHIGRLAELPGIADAITRALYLLRPLGRDELRATIIGPAEATGVRFEPPELVDEIADAVAGSASPLPLLQFALAEVWRERDSKTDLITRDVLDRVGGVTGALTKHADQVVSSLSQSARDAARRVLLRLVTVNGVRAARSAKELGDEAETAAALSALVAGRLLVVREVRGETMYEVAHEALLTQWRQFNDWVDEEAGSRVIRDRIAAAAAAWAHDGRRLDALWQQPQLARAEQIRGHSLSAEERAFLDASRRAVRRRRWVRWAIAIAALGFVVAVWAGFRWNAARELAIAVDRHVASGRTALDAAQQLRREADDRRGAAIEAFTSGKREEAEAIWANVRDLNARLDAALARVSQALEAGLRLDGSRGDARSLMAEVLFDRALLAEQEGHVAGRDELLARLATYDDGTLRRRWDRTGTVELVVARPATATLHRYDEDVAGRTVLVRVRELTLPATTSLPPGSYRLDVATGEVTITYPFVVARGAHDRLELALPARIPAGFVHVPAGRFLFGDRGSEEQRSFHGTTPIHERRTEAFLIARHETTLAEWIEFLDALPAERREQHRPRASGFQGTVELRGDVARWTYVLYPTAEHPLQAAPGEPLRYPDRSHRQTQDWRRFPVTGISWNDALAYVAWLRTTGRVPAARLCREDEWERAARGADDRLFAHGDQLEPDEANIDVTYGRRPLAYGPDEVGSHPASTSPFGLADMVGNAFEICASILEPDTPVARGGAFYFTARTATVTNRLVLEPNLRNATVGLRVCADPPRD